MNDNRHMELFSEDSDRAELIAGVLRFRLDNGDVSQITDDDIRAEWEGFRNEYGDNYNDHDIADVRSILDGE